MWGAYSAEKTHGRSERLLLFAAYLVLTLGSSTVIALEFNLVGGPFFGVLLVVGGLLFVPFWLVYRRLR